MSGLLGALGGIGRGAAQSGQMWQQEHLQRQREERLNQARERLAQENRDFQREMYQTRREDALEDFDRQQEAARDMQQWKWDNAPQDPTKLTYQEGAFFNPHTGEMVADHREALGLLGDDDDSGGQAGTDSAEYQRIMNMMKDPLDRTFSTHLGAEFLGDPDNAAIHAISHRVGSDIAHAAYRNGMDVPPRTVGAVAGELALQDRFSGMRPSVAQDMAQEEQRALPRSERRDFDVAGRASEIQRETAQAYRDAVAAELGMDGAPSASSGSGGYGSAGEGAGGGARQSAGAEPGGGAVEPVDTGNPFLNYAQTPGGLLSLADRSREQQRRASMPEPGSRIGIPDRSETESRGASHRQVVNQGLGAVSGAFDAAEEHMDRIGMARAAFGELTGGPITRKIGRARDYWRGFSEGERSDIPEEANRFFQQWAAGDVPDAQTTQAFALYVRDNNPDWLTDEQLAALERAVEEHGL